jgi:radical SAM protein with 4Fe4S-binding SPASM domain
MRASGRIAKPFKLTVQVTRTCDGRCSDFCDQWSQLPSDDELTSGALARVVESLGADLYWLGITGGEPTLKDGVSNLVRQVVDGCPNLLMVTVATNGRSPDRIEETVERLSRENPRVRIHVTVSIDGLGTLQDEIRGVGQWGRTLETWSRLHMLRRVHPNLLISAQTTVGARNLHAAAELQRVLSRESDDYIVTFVHDAAYYRNSAEDGMPSLRVSERALPVAVELARSYPVRGLRSLLIRVFLNGMVRRLRTGSTGIPCMAGWASLTLTPEGDVHPCLFRGDPGVLLGNVRTFDFNIPALLRSSQARRALTTLEGCQACWINCEALPSLILSPLRAARLLLGSFAHRRVDNESTIPVEGMNRYA